MPHKDTIEIESFSWGATNSTRSRSSGGGGGAGKVVLQDMHLTKAIDKSSPLLFKRSVSGQHIKKAVLHVRKAGSSQDYMKVTLSDCLVSSWQTKPQEPGSNTGALESVSLNFTKIEFAYTPQNPDGSLAGSPLISSYDLKALKK